MTNEEAKGLTSGPETVNIYGITCKKEYQSFPGGKKIPVYTFTCPGWEECTVTGYKAAKRVIRGRTDQAVLNTMGIKI